MLNPIESLQEQIQTRFPNSSTSLGKPMYANGVWALDIRSGSHWLVVDYRAPSRFGVSDITESTIYGEGADETYSDPSAVFTRVEALLTAR